MFLPPSLSGHVNVIVLESCTVYNCSLNQSNVLVFSNVLHKLSIMRSSCFLISGSALFLYVGEDNGPEAG